MDANFSLEHPETFKYVIPLTRMDPVDVKNRNRNALMNIPKNSLKLMQEKVCNNLPSLILSYDHEETGDKKLWLAEAVFCFRDIITRI